MICPKCHQTNTTLQWWHEESKDRWICYPCGMGRREEQNRIDQQWEKRYGSKITAQAPIS